MPSQCRSSGERLLAIRKWTLVWSFPRMYASMPRKRTRIAERLSPAMLVHVTADQQTNELPCRISRTCAVFPLCGREHGLSMLIAG